jgi:acetoin utilization deacetylase AcuC-like enzyme
MKIFYSDHFVLPLPKEHRFPMEKYALLRERVTGSAVGAGAELLVPRAATDAELETVHDPVYLRKVVSGTLSAAEVRRTGFPWSLALVERSRRSVGGTMGAARAALASGVAVNLSGGTHHAFAHRGEGFCIFNDVAVAVRVVQGEGRARRVAILDLDVHQGNGTAHIFRKSPEVFTMSVHGANNYPFRKVPGDLDLHLPDGAGDELFLGRVGEGLEETLDRGPFDLAFFLAGADPFEGDRLGKLGVSKEGLMERDRMVLSACQAKGIPVAVVMAGGYARSILDTVDIHFATVRTAARLAAGWRKGREVDTEMVALNRGPLQEP